MTNRTNFDRTLQSRFSGEIVTDYGIMDGNSTLLLVKAGNGGSHRGYEDKYLRLADHINRAHGWTVLCASNPQNGNKTLEGAMQIVREYAAGRGFEKFQVYYMGFSDGALIGARCGADHPEIRRMVLVNGPLMMNWHRTKAGILRFFGESATFVYGSLDPSYRYAELIRTVEKENPRIHLKIADGQDHYETVVTNSRKLADMISDNICPFPEEKALPYMEYADGRLESAARRALRELYGKNLPSPLSERLENELALTRGTPFATTYLIWRHIAQFCQMNGYPTALYGPSVGLRFLSYLLGIHRLNPLPPHYRCPACKHTIFYANTDKFPYEMPPHLCPQCGTEMLADGFSLTEQPRHGVHGSEIYVEVPNAIRKAAIEDLSVYLKENGNLLLHLSCTHQNPSPLGRDRRRLAEYEEKRGKPFSEEERAAILKKYCRRREVQYYQTLFCAMRDEPLYTFGPVTTVNGRTAVGFDFSELDEASKVYFLTNPDLDRLDALRSKIGIRTEKISFDDHEVLSALAEDFPNPPEAAPSSFREWMELCKRHPQAASFSEDRGRLYRFALQKYRLKWFELHYPEAWASTAAPERRKNG